MMGKTHRLHKATKPPSLWPPGRSRSPSSTEDYNGIPPPSYQAPVNKRTNLDITSHIERKLAQYNASQNIFKRWLFEIVSVAISAVCMGEWLMLLSYLYHVMTPSRGDHCDPYFTARPATCKMASGTCRHHRTI
jgi:hypothetical protein